MHKGFEAGVILRQAGTVWVGQLATVTFGVVDTLVAGHHSAHALAALSVGSAFYVSVYVALMGVVQAQLPVWSELRGAGHRTALGLALRQTLYLCAALLLVGVAALLSPDAVLRWTDVPPALRPQVAQYLEVLSVGLVPALLFRMFSTLNQALGRPVLVTWVQLGALGLKIPLSIWFGLGGLGLPAGGAVGCAWATVVVTLGMLVLAVLLLRSQALYVPYAL
ncbi:MAG: hypothetical protein RLZZ401_303, partial [Pseudomonadota bacterium]